MTLFRKILLSMLLLALTPLLVSSLILSLNLGNVREKLAAEISDSADRQASESLKLRAEQVAENISNQLQGCQDDLLLLAALPHSPRVLKKFYDSRNGEIWYRRATPAGVREVREWVPLYSSLAIIDAGGQETFVIREGNILPKGNLRHVALPEKTEFRSERYFELAKELEPGKIYVSHLTGFHVGKEEQLAGAADPESAVNGKEYKGVVRFATPLRDARGRFAGVAVLSLDHRHLMEQSQHILPGRNSATVFPSYKSGNYAFIFDDEGWIITHPKFWDIRGLDESGTLVPPYSASSSKEDIQAGRIPYNLDHAGFIHPNYPVVANLVRKGKSGYVDVTNVGGAKKVMAFAPIIYKTGDYSRHGIFGAVTIGFQVDQFHELARTGVSFINRKLQDHISTSLLLVACTCLMVALSAWALSRGIVRPLELLMEGTRKMASGSTGIRVSINSSDELGELAADFNMMAEELEARKNSLMKTLEELKRSRKDIMSERNFKESVLESISSAIMTFSGDGLLTSVNATGSRYLGEAASPGAHFSYVFKEWGDMEERVARVLAGDKEFGREPLLIGGDKRARYFEVGFFPIDETTDLGITVTMRDETEKERMREEITSMDRLASLGKLSAGLAHEIRNPLTGVSLLLDDLHDRATGDPESQELMRKALSEIERVERLITSLLSFSSPPKARFRSGDLNLVVHDTLLLLRRECERRKIEVRFAQGDLPEFEFDREKIKQACLNLLKNAMEAMPAGGIITVATAAADGLATLAIADDGPGIAAEDVPFIFEPFFSRKGAGTGLGLSVTSRVVQEHRGRITFDSIPGKGAAFTITLPTKQMSPEQPPQ